MLISTPDENVVARIFCKTTSIGLLYTDFTRFTLFSYKIGLIKTLLLHHGYEISSSWSLFDKERHKIKSLLTKNNYPSQLIDREIKQFFSVKY